MKLFDAIHLIDLKTFFWCLERKHRTEIVQVCRWISRSADGYLYILTGFLFLLLSLLELAEIAVVKMIIAGFGTERCLYFFLKNKLRRNRPQETIPGFQSVIQPSDQFSFPSGHTSGAFLMLGILGTVLPLMVIPLTIWAVWVGISRVMLGVHFPTDIVAGALLGYTISQCYVAIFL